MGVVSLLLISAIMASALFKRSLWHTVPLVFVGMAVLTYGTTFLNHKSAVYLVLILVCSLLTVTVIVRHRQNGEIEMPALSQCVFLVLLVLILWAATREWVPAHVDDRSHWTVFAAQMVAVERFPTGIQSCSTYSDYPPLTSLFQAILQPGKVHADVGMLYFAQRLLYMVLSLPVLPDWYRGSRIKYKVLSVLGGGIFVLAIPALFNQHAVYALAPDALMGFLAAWVIITAWHCREKGPDWFDVLQILTALAAVTLCKETGLGVALLAAFCTSLLLYKQRPVIMHLLWWITPLCAWGSWRVMCSVRGLSSYFDNEEVDAFSFEKVAQMIREPEQWMDSLPGFLNKLASMPVNGGPMGLSALSLWALMVLLLWRIKRQRPEWNKSITQVGITLMVATVLYALLLYYSYLFLFQAWERSVFAALDRYLSPLAAIAGLWLLYLVFRTPKLFYPKPDLAALLGVLVLGLSLNWQYAFQIIPAVYNEEWGDIQQSQSMTLNQVEPLRKYLETFDPQQAPIVLLVLDERSCALSQEKYLLAPSQVYTVYQNKQEENSREDFENELTICLQENGYNLFYAAESTNEWMTNEMWRDSYSDPLEAGIIYQQQEGKLIPVT